MSSTVVGPGQVIAGRYRIERWLGQGGMGSVYRAFQLSVQRTVALKRLVDEHLESASHIERFEREALALSRLSHQSTVRLFDFGSDERGCPFIVMEYLEGRDLAVDLERHGPMRWDQALAVAGQILGSLTEAHAAGIVHRDIKPANLFLCAGGEWPVVKVLDFGIAGGAEPSVGLRKLTLTGTVLGSAPYMSPEQAQGLPVSPAADLYALGVVLFEMLTGRTPFEPRTLTAQLIAKVLEVAPSLRDVRPELDAPPEVQALVASLLARDPEQRPPSARATAERIHALLARAALPPLSRAAQRPEAPAPPIARTQPMLVPRTIDEGWTPPRTEAPPGSTRSRAAVGWSLLLAAASTAAAGLWRALPDPPEASEPEATLAALRALPASNERPSEREPPIGALDAGLDSGVALERVATQTNVAEALPRTRSLRSKGRHTPARPRAEPAVTSAPRASPDRSSAAPAPEPASTLPAPSLEERSAPALGAPSVDPRYWTIAAARAAAQRGDITPAQRNEIILGLRQRRLNARSRAARAYREGRISFEALLHRQRAIERRVEGW